MPDNTRFSEEYFERRREEAKSGDTDAAYELIDQALSSLIGDPLRYKAVDAYLISALDSILDGAPPDVAFHVKNPSHRKAGQRKELHEAMAAAVQLVMNAGESEADATLSVSTDFEARGGKAGVRTVERAFKKYGEGLQACPDDELKAVIELTFPRQ